MPPTVITIDHTIDNPFSNASSQSNSFKDSEISESVQDIPTENEYNPLSNYLKRSGTSGEDSGVTTISTCQYRALVNRLEALETHGEDTSSLYSWGYAEDKDASARSRSKMLEEPKSQKIGIVNLEDSLRINQILKAPDPIKGLEAETEGHKRSQSLDGTMQDPAQYEKYPSMKAEIRALGPLPMDGYTALSSRFDGIIETAERHDKGHEREDEESFDLQKSITYIRSEEWYAPVNRVFWDLTGGHEVYLRDKERPFRQTSWQALIISMKSSQASITNTHSEVIPFQHTPPKGNLQESQQENGFEVRIPDRLAISCKMLLAEIAAITKTKLTPQTPVILHPFKMLIYHHDDFIASLKRQEELCDKLLRQQHARNGAKQEPRTNQIPPGVRSKETVQENDAVDEENKKKSAHQAEPSEGITNAQFSAKLDSTRKLANGLCCLIYFIENNLGHILDIRKQVRAGALKLISFEYLWCLFEPGTLVVSTRPKLQAYRVLYSTGGRPLRHSQTMVLDNVGRAIQIDPDRTQLMSDFAIDYFNIAFNGSHYGQASRTLLISPYEGVRSIDTFDIIPMNLFSTKDVKQVQEMLVARGQKFEQLARVSHKTYKGTSIGMQKFPKEEVFSPHP
jgi:hypothetical protein